MAEREGRRTEHAHEQERAVPEQSRGECLTVRDSERAEEQEQRSFAYPEPAQRNRDYLQHHDCGREREYAGERNREVERAEHQREHHDHRELVHHRSCDDRDGLHRIAPEAVDAEVYRADEARPILVVGEATRGTRVSRREQHDAEEAEGDARDEQRDPRVVAVEHRRPQREPAEHEHRQREESRQPLEHDRTERDFRRVERLRQATDPQHVSTDRGRQRVTDEQSREVVRRQGPKRNVHVEDVEHALPAPRRQQHPQERHHDGRGEQGEGQRPVPARDEIVDVRYVGREKCEQRQAHQNADGQLPS
jgi:hypothetical protein